MRKRFTIAALAYFTGGMIPSVTYQGQSQDADRSHLEYVIQLVIFTCLLAFMWKYKAEMRSALRYSKAILCVCLLASLSSIWSLEPLYTLKKSAFLWVFTLLAMFVAATETWEGYLDTISKSFLVVIFANLATVIIAPQIGVSGDLHAGAWKGMFSHKNGLGEFAGLAGLFFLTAHPPNTSVFIRRSAVLASILILLFARSATAALAFLVALLLLILWKVIAMVTSKPSRWFVPVAVLLAALLYVNAEKLFALFGKDASLTGRVPLWNAVLIEIRERPWLGFGYGAFWEIHNLYARNARESVGWSNAPHAHDGYLDCILDLGLCGLVAFWVSLQSGFRKAMHFAELDEASKVWPFVFFLFFVVFNISESSIYRLHTFLWFPFVATIVSLGRQESATEQSPPIWK